MRDLPIKVSELGEWLPHRPPMVWVDELLAVGENWGECRVIVSRDAHYMGVEHFRPTATIEWMAQTYGYTRAYLHGGKSGLRRAWLVGVRDLQIFEVSIAPREIIIRVEGFRDLGPFSMFQGEVHTGDGEPLATASLKVFGE